MLISCLLPTYNRFPLGQLLVAEAVESFLRQDYENKELILLNDCPEQTLYFNHRQVRVINANHRFPTLGAKLHWMLQQAQGEYICRWDDDDISLPWRLSYSASKVGCLPDLHGRLPEWRPENHWYAPRPQGLEPQVLTESKHPGNTHIMSIWHRNILGTVEYPGEPCPSGLEDQTFNSAIRRRGYPFQGDLLPLDKIFYLYRWGVTRDHLSGKGGGQTMQATYDALATASIVPGVFNIEPVWRADYAALASAAAESLKCQLASGSLSGSLKGQPSPSL